MTRTERVLDASVLVAFLLEEGLQGAEEACSGSSLLIAPDLIHLEVASVVAGRVWRGILTESQGQNVMTTIADVVDVFVPLGGLAKQAFALSAKLKCSAYDASYLALAMERGAVLVTSDRKFASCIEAAGLRAYVEALG